MLALSILCDNHERQMYTVIAEWNQKIARYVSEQAKHEEEQQQPSSSLTLDLQEAMDNVRKEMEKIKVERDGYQTQCANLLERNLRLAEAASARLMLEVSDRAKAETIQKLEREVEGRKKDVEEQKKLRSMNLAELQALRPFENSDRTKTEIIQRLEKELQGSNKGIEDQKKVHAEQVAELRALEQQVGDQKSLIDNLEAESQRDRLMREKSEREKSETIQKLEQKVQGKERDLEEQKRLHSEDLTKLDTLRQQKHESDSLLQNLHTEREDDERKIKDLVDRHRINETENKKRASGLERQNQGLRQQNQRFIRQNESLKQQKYLAAFRNALQLLIARKRCERAEQGNHVLVDEKANLIQRVETAEGKLAAADVSGRDSFLATSMITLEAVRLLTRNREFCPLLSYKTLKRGFAPSYLLVRGGFR